MRKVNSILDLIKKFITSIMGVVIYIITTIFLWKGDIYFIWEGSVGYLIGSILLLFPKSIENFIMAYLNKGESNIDIKPTRKRNKVEDNINIDPPTE